MHPTRLLALDLHSDHRTLLHRILEAVTILRILHEVGHTAVGLITPPTHPDTVVVEEVVTLVDQVAGMQDQVDGIAIVIVIRGIIVIIGIEMVEIVVIKKWEDNRVGVGMRRLRDNRVDSIEVMEDGR